MFHDIKNLKSIPCPSPIAVMTEGITNRRRDGVSQKRLKDGEHEHVAKTEG